MTCYKILCYHSEFKSFKNHASERLAKMSAKAHDQFALLMAVTLEGAVGFDETPQGSSALNTLVEKCYWVNLHKLNIQPPSDDYYGCMPSLLFRDKNGGFEKLYQEHIEYEKKLRKYQVMARHRPTEKPKISMLASILQDQRLLISGGDLYDALMNACHYLLVPVLSGEHGPDAFIAFSNNLDYFFQEFSSAVDHHAEITFVDSVSKLAFY